MLPGSLSVADVWRLRQDLPVPSLPSGVIELSPSGGDDTAAILSAIATVTSQGEGTIVFQQGTYSYSQNLVVSLGGTTPQNVELVFLPGAVLMPTSAVTHALTLATNVDTDGATSRLAVRGMRLDGVHTSGAVGVLAGDNAAHVSGRITMENCEILRFAGTGGIGLYVKDLVDGAFRDVYVSGCDTNQLVSGSDPLLPTTVTFERCNFNLATHKGTKFDHGYKIRWRDCTFESNGEEGLYCVPAVGSVVNNSGLENCWFEDNFHGGAQSTNYNARLDGSSDITTGIDLKFVDCFFTTTGLRGLYGKSVTNLTLDNVRWADQPNELVIDTFVFGALQNNDSQNCHLDTMMTSSSPNTFLISPSNALSAQQSNGSLNFTAPNTAPISSPVTGAIYQADGSSWDPLSRAAGKPYLVYWNGTAYKAVSAA